MAALSATRMNEVLERWERWGREVVFCLFLINWGGDPGGEMQIWRDWEVSGVGVYNVKFPKT